MTVQTAAKPAPAEPSTAVAVPERKRSVLLDMSGRFGMEPIAFEATLRATVVPKDCSREQFAAFLLVARDYGLNPITKEIYAFPSKGGGIQPIVGIDGWMSIINRQPMLDGIEFEDHMNAEEKIIAITCKIYRKDRSHPIEITEYMAECVRNTDTWRQWPARMLRHKAAIQCARYAFGISGLQDPDEYERMEVQPHQAQYVPKPQRIDFKPAESQTEQREEPEQAAEGGAAPDPEALLQDLIDQLETCATMDHLDELIDANGELIAGFTPPEEATWADAVTKKRATMKAGKRPPHEMLGAG